MKMKSVLLSVVVLIAACSMPEAQTTTSPVPPETTTSLPTETTPAGETVAVPLCSDLEWITGPEEMYGDSPIYVGNEMPIEEVIAHAQNMDGFVEAWLDREHNGRINVGFDHTAVTVSQQDMHAHFPNSSMSTR